MHDKHKKNRKLAAPRTSASLMKWVSLICLTLQTTSIIILYSYSRVAPKGAVKYLSSTVCVMAEVLKLSFYFLVILKDLKFSIVRSLSLVIRETFGNFKESIKVLVPATLYALQNNLAFFALNNLDPASYQVAYQLKIFTTAMFSVLMVDKRIRRRQWFALFLLFVGVSLVQLPQDNSQESLDAALKNSEKNRFIGIISVIACCMSSGFSGVYYERLTKLNPKQPTLVRNFQLAAYCLFISVIAMFYQDYKSINTMGMFQGYSNLTWIIVFLQAWGGLIVASVIKYADNVLKGFATSISIILSTLLSFYLFDSFDPSTNFYFGATIVIISVFMYGK